MCTRRTIMALVTLATCMVLSAPAAAKVIYVDDDAEGANDGSSWQNAYLCLQNAVEIAISGDEIRVAKGVYRPEQRTFSSRLGTQIHSSGDRHATFQLITGVILRGGYAGSVEPDPNLRNTELYETILSGDLRGDDRSGFVNNAENSYHVVTGSGTDETAILDGVTIRGGNANGSDPSYRGGGMYCHAGSPLVVNCRFIENSAGQGGAAYMERSYATFRDSVFRGNTSVSNGAALKLISSSATIANCSFSENMTLGGSSANGGAIDNDNSSPAINNCTFLDNRSAGFSGGALMNYGGSCPTVVNCVFQNNEAGAAGGAMSNWIFSSPLVINCVFAGNSADRGGGIANIDNCDSTIINCTLVGNRARTVPGGVYCSSSRSTISNCILWENTGSNGGSMSESAQIISVGPGSARVNHCDIQGLAELGGVGNFSQPPLFADANGADNVIGTPDDDLRLQAGSPCIDAGDVTEFPPSIGTDLAGLPRVVGTAIDLGAYEGAYEPPNAPERDPKTIYVDSRASGANSGFSWVDAFLCLQDALTVAIDGDEIRVAQGIYKPDQSIRNHLGGTGDRTDTFQLRSGVALRGGYAGVGGQDPNARDAARYLTILSGDLNGDDIDLDDASSLLTDPHRSDNSYHVLSNESTEGTTTLEGFTIAGGNADENSGFWGVGGGLYNIGVLTITDCVFLANAASMGAGLSSAGSGPLTKDASLTLVNCTFSRNRSGGSGGALCIVHSYLVATECTFLGNSTGEDTWGWGAAIYNENSQTTIGKSMFFGNRSLGDGGGIMNTKYGNVALTNCVFAGNAAKQGYGGAICSRDMSYLTLVNCTLSGNFAGYMGGGVCERSGDRGDLTIENSILWGNACKSDMQTSSQIATFGRRAAVNFSCIQGLRNVADGPDYLGNGNISADPHLTADGHLRMDSPCIDAGALPTGLDLEMTDSDEDSRFASGRIDIGADEFVDSDSDGLPDWWERMYFGSITGADPNDDADGDGLPNLDEYESYSSNPTADPLHVDPNKGPYWTIQRALDAAQNGDTILVAQGTYAGPNNRNLDLRGKSVVLRATDGPERTVIDCEGRGRGFDFHSGETAGASVIGFTITNGQAEQGAAIRCEASNAQFRRCVIVDSSDPNDQGAALHTKLAMLTLADCSFSGNSPRDVFIDSGSTRIVGTVDVASSELTGYDLVLYGEGTLRIQPDVILELYDCRIDCDVSGPGRIYVPLDSELIVGAEALIDLGHETDPNGLILCDGLLRAKDEAVIANAQIRVTRASFEDNAIVANCIFEAEAGAPYGQFFIEDSVQIWLDAITADGDRYLDLDPRVFDCNNIHANAIYVDVTEGVGGTYGGLLDLRGRDLALSPCGSGEFLCPIQSVPDFGPDTWTLDRLELVEGAKLNLTNRFDFQAPYDTDGEHEVLYVRDLVLGPNSVLNTAYNRVYYETLTMAPTAEIVHVPLLGFSLNNITFDDENDFRTRVTHNNHIDENPEAPDTTRIHVERVLGHDLDPNGVMRMCNLRDIDPDSPARGQIINARARGLFAKSSEEEILIRFEYLFCDPAGEGELVIYLSDIPEMLAHGDPLRDLHYLEVTRLLHPPAGRPGSARSGMLGIFEQVVSRGDLDFVRGTRVEFELIGPDGTCLVINNWDPAIRCTMTCGDVAGAYHQVNAVDFLAVMSECGRRVEEVPTPGAAGAWCLDGFFCADGFVTTDDALAIDWVEQKSLCPDGLLAGGLEPLAFAFAADVSPTTWSGGYSATEATFPLNGLQGEFLIAGKRYEHRESDIDDFLSDRLYGMNRYGKVVSGPFALENDRLNGRLVRDHEGTLYQLNLERGVVRLADDFAIIGPTALPVESEPRYGEPATVYVGFQQEAESSGGRPLLDAAFDAEGHIYVVPVVVAPMTGAAYLAAAKLEMGPDSAASTVLQLFDNPGGINDNRVTDQLREIAVDAAGKVYVLNCHCNNSSDILWVYSGQGHLLGWREFRELNIAAPVGLCLSTYDPSRLYVSSSWNRPDSTEVKIYVLSTDGLAVCEVVTVENLGHVTDIGENPLDGTVCVVGFAMSAIPTQSAIQNAEVILNASPFYEPRVAVIPYGTAGAAEAIRPAATQVQSDLALPLSVVWNGSMEGAVDVANVANP